MEFSIFWWPNLQSGLLWFFLTLLVRSKSLGWVDYTGAISEAAYHSAVLLNTQTAFTYQPFSTEARSSPLALQTHSLDLSFCPILGGPPDMFISESSHTLPWLHFSLLPSLHHSWNIWTWEASHPVIIWGWLIQFPHFANERAEAQGRDGPSGGLAGSQGQGWDAEPRMLPICCTSQHTRILAGKSIQTRHLNSGETADISSTYKWGKYLGSASPCLPIPFFTGGWLHSLLGAGKDLLVNWAANMPFCVKI